MKRSISIAEREAIKAKGFTRYLLIDGLLKMGGAFAVLMTIFGYFIEYFFNGASLGDYVSDPKTWFKFIFLFVFFGLVVGFIGWKANEREIQKTKT